MTLTEFQALIQELGLNLSKSEAGIVFGTLADHGMHRMYMHSRTQPPAC